jgi:aspartate racemase
LSGRGSNVKKIGLVGGVGWRSTVEYYAGLCRRAEDFRKSLAPGARHPTSEIIIESLDHVKAVSLLGDDDKEESWSDFDAYHRTALLRLETAGAEVAAISSNSPHHRFEAIVRGVRIPVISIFDASAKECARIGARQVLILGTELIMRSARIRESFARQGIEAAGPGRGPGDDAWRARTVELIADLEQGRVEGAADRLGNIAWAAYEELFDGLPIVCLACTELALAFPEHAHDASFDYCGAKYISSTAAHIDAIFDAATD